MCLKWGTFLNKETQTKNQDEHDGSLKSLLLVNTAYIQNKNINSNHILFAQSSDCTDLC